MEKLKIVIIGNKLNDFANNKNILTYQQFNYLLKIESKLAGSTNKYKIHLGQGLSDLQIKSVFENIYDLNLIDRFSLSGVMHKIGRAGCGLTHKIKTENSMISEPEKISELTFRSYLMLDESCAEMSDHITGQHIQGMVLIEAARQMVNAVSEKFLIHSHSRKRKGFVLHSLNSTFLEYIFPLDVEFIFKLEKLRHGLDGNFKAHANIQALQNSKLMMSIDIGFSVMEKNTLLGLESQRAETAVEKVINTQSLRLVNQHAA